MLTLLGCFLCTAFDSALLPHNLAFWLQGYHRSHAGLVALKAINTVLCMVYANSKNPEAVVL